MSWPVVWCAPDEASATFAFVNSFANLGGLLGPALIGLLSHEEQGAESSEHFHALALLGGCAIFAGAMAAAFPVMMPVRNKA